MYIIMTLFWKIRVKCSKTRVFVLTKLVYSEQSSIRWKEVFRWEYLFLMLAKPPYGLAVALT